MCHLGNCGGSRGGIPMNLRLKCTTIALVVTTVSFFSSISAFAYSSAPLTVCNKIAFPIGVAFGYYTPGTHDPADHSLLTGPFVSRGWMTIEVGQCATIPNPFNARYVYWFPTFNIYDDRVRAMRTADAPQHFCVNNFLYPSGPAPVASMPVPAFTYERENESAAACDTDTSMDAHNFWVIPREVDTWVNPTVDFTPQMVPKPE